jgi:hypothetical protein
MDQACRSSLVVPEKTRESGFEGTEYFRSISKPCEPPPCEGVRLRTILPQFSLNRSCRCATGKPPHIRVTVHCNPSLRKRSNKMSHGAGEAGPPNADVLFDKLGFLTYEESAANPTELTPQLLHSPTTASSRARTPSAESRLEGPTPSPRLHVSPVTAVRWCRRAC